MADATASTLIQNVLQYQYNPVAIQRAVMQTLSNATDGKIDIVDATSPFVALLETSSVLVAAAMQKMETLNRRQYPFSAQTPEDLYLHMSDKDFVNRFAIPTKTKFTLAFPKEEVLLKMVADPMTGVKKVVIPRNTFFTIAETDFSLQYPIEIRQLAHGGIQVVYDGDVVSPLQSLNSNVIDHDIRRHAESGEWLFFSFDVQQFSIISQTNTLNSAVDFKVTLTVQHQYYYTRVYVENALGNWVEIRTTHTDQVYDVATPTAVLKVLDKNVTVSIPQIYTGTGQLNKGIRIDVYQTKGPLDIVLSEYPFSAFSATWLGLDNADNTIYTAPLKTFRSIVIYSDQVVSGGSNALSFAELRQRVIQNAIGSPQLPITNVQVEVALRNQGYQVVKNIDNITNRVFQATKEMPTPIDTRLITAAASSIEMISLSLEQAVEIDTVIDNGASITLTPDTLYQNINGVIKLVTTNQKNYLLSLTPDKRALVVTQGGYLYTPFHYVLDVSGNEFSSRPYYLDDPVVETKIFVAENDSTLIQVNTKSYGILRTATGYQLQVVTQSGDAFKALDDDDVHVQLTYIPAGEKDYAYLNGVLVGTTDEGERSYTFDLSTNFNVDSNDNLKLSEFFLYTTEPRLTGAPLLTDFDIIYSTSIIMGPQWQSNEVDQKLGRFLLPNRIAGITHEKLRVRFGYSLKTLWARSRSVISSVPYQTYLVDVPRFYEKDIYVVDENGSAITFDVDGNPVTTLLHSAGDPVLDNNDDPVYRFRVGDVVLDVDGNPVTSSERGMIRQLDVMLIEGVYWFATDQAAIKYRKTLTETVVGWLTNDLAELEKSLLDQTRIYFYPKTTLGSIDVLVGDGRVKAIAAGQAFRLTLRVNKLVYTNTALRERLAKSSIKVISDQLKATTVSLDAITTALRAQYGNDVISVQVTGLGGNDNLQTLTITDDADRCSIRKRLTALPDDSLIVEEDIVVDFIQHEINT